MADGSARPKVQSIAIELTAHCNQKCSYCYNEWRGDDDPEPKDPQHEANLLARVGKLLAAFELDHFTVTGGEPFSRPELWTLLDLLADGDVGVHIISNGGLITDRVAERLAPYAVRYVQVTLNGHDEALHAEHAGGPGHFEQALRGIRLLKKHDIEVVGCVVVTRKNARELGKILALWESLEIHHIALSRFSPAGYATKSLADLLPSRGDIIEAFDQALPFAKDRGMRINCTMPIPPCMFETNDYAPIGFGHCAVGTSMQELALGYDGSLRNCTLHAKPLGGVEDILDEQVDLHALLDAPERSAYLEQIPEFCEGCLHARSCGGGCGAAALWVLGEEGRRMPDPFLWQHIDDEFEARLAGERQQAEKPPSKNPLEVLNEREQN